MGSTLCAQEELLRTRAQPSNTGTLTVSDKDVLTPSVPSSAGKPKFDFRTNIKWSETLITKTFRISVALT